MKLLIFTQKVDKKDPILGYFVRWIEFFSKVCGKVTVICLYEGENPLPDNIKILSLGKEKGESKLKYLIRFYKYIWKERDNYDNVFVHMNQIYVVLGGIFWRVWGKRIGFWYAHKSITPTLIMAEKLTHLIFTGSKESFRLKSKKINVMGQGVDIDKFKPQENKERDNKFKIVGVGRISPVKNFETLIGAAKILKDSGTNNFRIDIIGGSEAKETDYFKRLKENVIKNKLEQEISFVGPIENSVLPEYIGSSDVFVNSGDTGGLDKTGIEAMSMGIILLVSSEAYTGVLKDFPELMFNKGDSKMLAEKIKSIMVMSEREKIELGKKLREIVKIGHNVDTLTERIISLY